MEAYLLPAQPKNDTQNALTNDRMPHRRSFAAGRKRGTWLSMMQSTAMQKRFAAPLPSLPAQGGVERLARRPLPCGAGGVPLPPKALCCHARPITAAPIPAAPAQLRGEAIRRPFFLAPRGHTAHELPFSTSNGTSCAKWRLP